METWYKVTLSDQDIIAAKGLRLQDEFTACYIRDLKSRKDALMLDASADNASQIVYYFSPGAVRIAKSVILRWGGKPCPAPSPKGVAKLVGSVAALRAIFSQTEGTKPRDDQT